MGEMTLEEAIIHAREVAKTKRAEATYNFVKLESYYNWCSKCANEHEQLALWLEELKHYKEMKSQNLLMELPCSTGTDVYKIPSKPNYDLNILNGYKGFNRVFHQKVYNIVFTTLDRWYVLCDKDSIDASSDVCVDTEYGKTWFTSREEAEKKLEEMGNDKN